jgi:hypothetical protein
MMKAALVSATSLAALLAFEVGMDVAIDAHPASAQSFSATPAPLNFGYVLLNTSGGTSSVLALTVSNSITNHNTITFPAAATTPFSGSSAKVTLSNTINASAIATNAYTYAPTTMGANSTSLTVVGVHNGNVTVSSVVTLTGQAVAPMQSTSQSASSTTIAGIQSGTTVRIGTTATIAAITVANVGNGDMYSNTSLAAQLQVSLGTPSNSVFTGAATSFTLHDSNGTGTTVSASNYAYAPTAHSGPLGTPDSATVALTFANGSSAGTNAPQTGAVTLTGTGVGPVFKGVYSGTTYTNATAIGTSVNNAGNIALGTQKHGATTTFTLTLSNATTDKASTLTNLTLNGFSLGTCVVTGCVYDGFSVLSFTTGAIGEGNSVDVTLDFSGGLATYYDADLSIFTDQGAATGVGGTGAVFSYLLTANIPEPATIITFGMGLAGLGWARRRRAARRSGIDTDASPA